LGTNALVSPRCASPSAQGSGLAIASVLTSMGMMLPPVVSLPFKLIFFVLVDGWTLVAGSLVQSYGT
jgi:type III secretory pathway component EscR